MCANVAIFRISLHSGHSSDKGTCSGLAAVQHAPVHIFLSLVGFVSSREGSHVCTLVNKD